MIALDANVLLRLVVEDDPKQLKIAQRLISEHRTFVPLTVTLECEWVLRSFYKFTPKAIATALDALTDVSMIVFEHVDGVRWALERLVAGADFADMVHLIQANAAEAHEFATFDGGVRPKAGGVTPLPIRTLA